MFLRNDISRSRRVFLQDPWVEVGLLRLFSWRAGRRGQLDLVDTWALTSGLVIGARSAATQASMQALRASGIIQRPWRERGVVPASGGQHTQAFGYAASGVS